MNILVIIIQLLLFSAGAFVVLALLMSHLRFRKMQLTAEDHEEGILQISEAVLLLMKRLRSQKNAQLGLICFDLASVSDEEALFERLKASVRKEDEIFRLPEQTFLGLFECPPENLPAVAQRLIPLLKREGVEGAQLSMRLLDFDVTALQVWMEQSVAGRKGADGVVLPSEWPYQPEEMSQTAAVDDLTGVLKADRIPRAVRRMAASQRRAGRNMTILCADVDQLESYNEKYGRAFGDRLLKEAGRLLMDHCRERDLVGRWEEDCFLLVMKGDVADHLSAAMRISEEIKQARLEFEGAQIRFSVGVGLASMPQDGRNPMVLIDRALLAMQEGKQRGRGLCVAYQPSFSEVKTKSPVAKPGPESF
ncbi:GGDEF domain-containing protein [Kiritimatiellota bacterium B12222]|nr:GGDEF domain-containing protein [Kiritimatiellota bacterium B12222]